MGYLSRASLTEVRNRRETESGLGIPLLVFPSVRICSLQEKIKPAIFIKYFFIYLSNVAEIFIFLNVAKID